MPQLLIIPVLIFIIVGFALILVGIKIFFKKEFSIALGNIKWWYGAWLILLLFISGAYSESNVKLSGWKKRMFAILFIIFGICLLIVFWRLLNMLLLY